MNTRGGDFKLGLFVVIGIVLLLIALFVFGASRFFQRKTVAETYVAGSVEGLKTGAQVTLRGVPVGEVTRINFSWNIYHFSKPRYVVVQFTMANDVALVPPGPRFVKQMQAEIRRGLRARIKSQGLTGVTLLSLEYVQHPAEHPPLPFPWKPHHLYIPSAPGQFTEIMTSVKDIMANLKQLNFQQLSGALQRDLAAGERLLARFNQANVAGVTTNVDALVTEFRGIGRNVDTLVTELRFLSARMQDFIGPAPQPDQAENLRQVIAHADQVLTRLRTTIDRLDAMAANLDTAALNQTLENARRASASLDQVLRQLKEYPSGFIFGHPPPPAKDVERPR